VTKLGVSLNSAHLVDDVRDGARRMVERARASWEAGLDSLFVGDHHNVPLPYYQNSPILGRLLAEWGDRPAGAFYLLPLWHPVLVAEQVGTLAAIAGGRFVLQCAVGGGADQFSAMGADLRRRGSTFERNLDVVRRLSRGETVDGTRIAPTPPEPLEVWIGGHAPPALDRAARLGDGWLAGPESLPAQARALADAYLERCAAHGRRPTAVAIRRDVHIGTDDRDAARVADPILVRGYRGFDPGACVVGGPESVADQFRALAAIGYTDVIVRHLAADQREVLASTARLAEVRAAIADT
jgi:alkanesulfonate monooxygenase SsuD/methylene tetrahydromethanopterin reductase-like flavin-dependent oxidoreductase (luciferase family)